MALTGWQRLDPVIAMLVGLNIVRAAFQILRRSIAGLMDASLPPVELAIIARVMAVHEARGVTFHALRTRQAAAQRFVSVHLLVPAPFPADAHHLAEASRAMARTARNSRPDASEPVDDDLRAGRTTPRLTSTWAVGTEVAGPPCRRLRPHSRRTGLPLREPIT
ncbi:MAG: hypothetical protein IPO18_19440 [bacterium]|nr:hypothetical protein [bacterium]